MLRVFLVEAGVLGFVGGVLGAAVGWVIARVVGGVVNGYLESQGLVRVALVFPLWVLGGAVVGSTLLAAIAGTLPAIRAARSPAREALGAV